MNGQSTLSNLPETINESSLSVREPEISPLSYRLMTSIRTAVPYTLKLSVSYLEVSLLLSIAVCYSTECRGDANGPLHCLSAGYRYRNTTPVL